MATVATSTRQMRVALLWNGTLHSERMLDAGESVIVGSTARAMFPLPEGAVASEETTLLRPVSAGFELVPPPGLGGFVWLNGSRTPARSLNGPTGIGTADYGLVTLGSVAFFFQYVTPAQPMARERSGLGGALFACLGLSLFVHVGSLLFLFLVAAREFPATDTLELDTELLREFLVVPPPEELEQKESGTNTPDPGMRDRDEAGGKAHENEEGRVGRADAKQKDTTIAGERTDEVSQKVAGLGLLGALSGGSNAMSNALNTPSLDSMLSGLGAVQTIVGQGSGGMGLRGQGSGGGGTGRGVLFGAGNLGTGVGNGTGSGLGKGKGGIGVKGREAREATLSLESSAARVSGYLSEAQILAVVKRNQAAIKYCFDLEFQKQPNLKGRVAINWRIDLQGRVSTVRVAQSTLNNERVEGCMTRQIKRWQFPQPDGGSVDVTFPFLMRGG